MIKRAFLLICGFVAIIAGGMVLYTHPLPERIHYTGYYVAGASIPTASEIGAFAPPLQQINLDGTKMIDIKSLRGEGILINFWATWCAPCLLEMPDLQQLHEEYTNLHIIGVNLNEHPQIVMDWMDKLGLTFDIVIDRGEIIRHYPRYGPPATYLVGRDGLIKRIDYGTIDLETLRQALNQAGIS